MVGTVLACLLCGKAAVRFPVLLGDVHRRLRGIWWLNSLHDACKPLSRQHVCMCMHIHINTKRTHSCTCSPSRMHFDRLMGSGLESRGLGEVPWGCLHHTCICSDAQKLQEPQGKHQ